MVNTSSEPVSIVYEGNNFPHIKNNLKDLVSHDHGLNREVFFRPPSSKDTLRESPAIALNRSALIADTLDKLVVNPDSKIAFLMLDLSDMHFADKAGAGDFVLNRFSRALLEELIKFKLEKNQALSEADVNLCRYGGDEFCVSITGQYGEQVIDDLKTVIAGRYKKDDLKGYFKKGLSPDDPVVERPIKLKEREDGEVVDVIRRPDSPEGRKIFDQFMRRGQILSNDQVNMAEKLPQLRDFINQEVPLSYPKDVLTVKSKLNHIASRFPNLRADIEALGGSHLNDSQRQEVLKYLEDRVFDKLFGSIVYTSPEFAHRLPDYRDLYCFDLKLVREMNEIASYPEADMAIVNLYNLIKGSLGDDLMNKVDIGRRGGTFYVGVKKGWHSLNHGRMIKSALAGISVLPMELRGKPVNFDLGVSFISREKGTKNFGLSQLDNLSNMAEEDFMKKIARYLAEPRMDGRTNLQFIFSHRDFNNPEEFNYMGSLVQEFFLSKRSLLRTNKMQKLLYSENGFSGEEYNQLRLVMGDIHAYALKMQRAGKPVDQGALLDQLDRVVNSKK